MIYTLAGLVLIALCLSALCLLQLRHAFDTLNRYAVYSDHMLAKFAETAMEMLKAQNLAEHITLDTQRTIALSELEPELKPKPKVMVATEDGKMVDINGGEWELL